jgi:hypothetical protein
MDQSHTENKRRLPNQLDVARNMVSQYCSLKSYKPVIFRCINHGSNSFSSSTLNQAGLGQTKHRRRRLITKCRCGPLDQQRLFIFSELMAS